MGSSSLGQLTLDLVARIGSFTGPLDKAERASKKNAAAISKHQREITGAIGNSLKSLAGWAAGFVAFGAIKSFVTSSFAAADAIGKVAATAGITTDTLQEMRHAAMLNGISFEQIDNGIQKLNKNMGDLRAGSGSLYTYLMNTDRALLSQVQSAKSADEALDLIFRSMKNLENSSDRSALAVAAFGKSGQRLTLVADEYENLRKEARDLGLVIDSDLIKGAEVANDKMGTMSNIIKTQLTSAIIELAPAIQSAATAMIDLSKKWAWILGGEKRSNERLAELQETTAEIQNLNSILKEQRDIQTRLTALKNHGSWYDPDELKQAENNIQSIIESIKELNGTKIGVGTSDGGDAALSQQQSVEIYKKAFSELETITQKTYDVMKSEYQSDRDEFIDLTGDKLTAQAIYNKNMEALNKKLSGGGDDSSWEDFGKIIKATSDANKERLEIIKSSNLAIMAENDRMLQADIAKDAEYHQLVDQANIAELNNITDNVERELALHEYKYEKLKELYEEGSAELTEIERAQAAERAAIIANSDYWSGYLESLEGSMGSMDSIVGDSLNNWSSQFGDFFATAILDSENLESAFKKMAMNMVSTAISAIGKMIAQWLIYKVVKIATDKVTQAAAIPSYIANAEAGALLAGINAYASAAAIPYAGWVLAPAAMAAALAVTQPMVVGVSAAAIAGLAHDGIDSIPETGTWLLKKGERVTTSQTSKRLDDTLSRIQNGGADTGRYSPSRNRGGSGSGESHFHVHYDGPVFLNRSQMIDTAKMLMKETDRERTRIGAVN